MAYNKEAQKKYNGKSNYIQLKFTENQINDYLRIKKYCDDNGLSTQGYIKSVILRDLDEKGIAYPDTPGKEEK